MSSNTKSDEAKIDDAKIDYAKTGEAKCPFSGGAGKHTVARGAPSNADWWPNQLKLEIRIIPTTRSLQKHLYNN